MVQFFNTPTITTRNRALEHRARLLLGGAAERRPAASILNYSATELMLLTLGLIGYGHFGAFLHVLGKRYLPGATLMVYAPERAPDGELFFTLEEVAACDAVILAIPISAYKATLGQIHQHLSARSVVLDIATVKQHTIDLLEATSPSVSFISMHPMFGPESYSQRNGDVDGFRVVITGHNLASSTYDAFRNGLIAAGFTIIETTAAAHDRDLAETLFLTHYIGQIVARGGFKRSDINTVSFGSLMDAVDSVRHDTRLFEDVFRFNPYCREVIERFEASDREVRDLMLGLPPAGT